ncbi:tumor necrosis factor receptor superfamily member 13B [Varanus komodoensis]|uniref:tumor necrosis factor receptor superfamily member 13B n=1 Tax=Varanus komodoensis TaxID=61221 RepID=UPI001CF76C08|nr:tumor necrosis factor receptor superfamily member 13B [Varanus komodoensis]
MDCRYAWGDDGRQGDSPLRPGRGNCTSPGHFVSLHQTMLCPKEQYWDELLWKCIPCRLACHPLKVKGCADICASMDCSKRVGFFYDSLLRKCINCSSICGQHPIECLPFCRKDLAATLPAPAALQAIQCRLDGTCNQTVVIYLVFGFCLCTLLFSLLVTWICFRKTGEDMMCPASTPCRKRENSPKDRLMEAESMGTRSNGSQTPEPVETCGFCFPEVSPAVQETRACHSSYQFGTQGDAAVAGDMGTAPTPEDGHFQIICSPSQEKI